MILTVPMNEKVSGFFSVPSHQVIGHYTQVAWAQSYKIGCGKTVFFPVEDIMVDEITLLGETTKIGQFKSN